MSEQGAGYGEDALKDADIKSGDDPPEPVHSPPISEDEGHTGHGQGEGKATESAPGAGGPD